MPQKWRDPLAENPPSGDQRNDAVNGNAAALPGGQAKVPPADEAHKPSIAGAPENGRNNGKQKTHNFLSRLTVNEWLTLLVGFGSLVISYLTYKNAADTSDLQKAVNNLATLAEQARRQADAQRGQLDEMRVENRAWISVKAVTLAGPLIIYNNHYKMDLNFVIENKGRLPATNVRIGPLALRADQEKSFCYSKVSLDAATDPDLFGSVLFPGEERTILMVVDLRATEQVFNPLIVGCAIYKFSPNTPDHHTGFFWIIVRKAENGHIALEDGTIAPSELSVIKTPGGDFTD